MGGTLEGKVALVTGAARGQGRSHAVRLAQEGAAIIAVDIAAQIDSVPYPLASAEDLAHTAKLVDTIEQPIFSAVADVRNRDQLKDVIDAGVAEMGGTLDIVVANAGISPIGPTVPVAGWLDTVSVNLCGVVNTLELALPHMTQGGSIICIGSMAALMGGMLEHPEAGPGAPGYVHAKRGVVRLVHDLAKVLAPQSIRVNAVHPGNIDTPMIQNESLYRVFRPDLEQPGYDDVQPLFGAFHLLPVNTIPPEDVAEAVLFLASDASRYITGQQLKVEAGALLRSTASGAPD